MKLFGSKKHVKGDAGKKSSSWNGQHQDDKMSEKQSSQKNAALGGHRRPKKSTIEIKKFLMPCTFGPTPSKFPFFIGDPKPDNHALYNQDMWLAKNRGGALSPEIKSSIAAVQKIASQYSVPLSQLVSYVIKLSAEEESSK